MNLRGVRGQRSCQQAGVQDGSEAFVAIRCDCDRRVLALCPKVDD